MHKHHGPPDTSKGYEQTDLAVSDLLKGVVGFFVFTGGSAIAAFIGLYLYGGTKFVDAAVRPIPAAPNPLLQSETTAKVDIWNLRYREKQALTSFGDSKVAPGTKHIPIDSAIDILTRDGLPKGASQ